MKKIRVAVLGFGNVSREAVKAIRTSPDMELAGVVLRNPAKIPGVKRQVPDSPVVKDISELDRVDVVILGIPSRAVPEMAKKYLKMGLNTVDSYDIHGESILNLKQSLDAVCKNTQRVAVISAGWDPGSDSVVRALMESIAPRGLTYTNFGPGMSMGHTVAVKAIESVEDALSITIPKGQGLHKRMVYVKLKPGTDFEKVKDTILRDPYFAHDETHVFKVADVKSLIDMGHGVHIERKGVSGETHNQRIEFKMSVANPAATAQVMVSAARASMRQAPGCYTMIEIPPLDYLYGDREQLILRLV